MPADELDRVVADLEHGTTNASKILRELRVTRADAIAPTRIAWLWPGWLPASRLTLAGGKPGDGKSSVTIDLAARLSTASPMPDGHRPAEPINVAILSAEDGASDTIVPRLIVAGANRGRIYIVGGIVSDLGIERSWILPDDILELAAFVNANEIGLLIVDPLSAFQSASVDTHRDGAVRGMLTPLAHMADEFHCAVLAVRHHRKGGATDARDAGSGSIAYTAAARVEWAAGTDPDDATRFVLAVSKINIAAKPQSLAYRIAQDEEYETNRIVWEGGSNVTASDLTGERQSDEERSALDEAKAFLLEVLTDGPVPTNDVSQQAKAAGIEAASLKRARKRLGVTSRKTAAGPWELELPTEGDREPIEGERATPLAPLAPLAPLPCSEYVCSEDFTRENDEGGQGGQGGQSLDGRTSSLFADEREPAPEVTAESLAAKPGIMARLATIAATATPTPAPIPEPELPPQPTTNARARPPIRPPARKPRPRSKGGRRR